MGYESVQHIMHGAWHVSQGSYGLFDPIRSRIGTVMAKRGRKRTPFDVGAALGKATRLFRTQGYRGTSIQDIVDGTGISRARLYETFGDKQGLFLTVLERYEQEYELGRLAESARTGSPRRVILNAFESIVTTAPEGGVGCLMINTALEVSPKDGTVAELAQRGLSDIERNFRASVEAGKAAGEVAAAVDAHQTASALLSLLIGLHVLARSRPEPELLSAVAAQAAVLLGSPGQASTGR